MGNDSNLFLGRGHISIEEVEAAMEILSSWNDGNDRIRQDVDYLDAVSEGLDELEADEGFSSVFKIA